MKVFNDYRELITVPNLVVALGNFDGVHLGHRELIKRSQRIARELDGTPALFTFDPHPLKILQPQSYPPMLLSKKDKIKMLEQAGVEALVIADFSADMANLEPDEFVKQIIVEGFNVRAVVVGYNYSFGKGGKGTPDMMVQFGKEFGFKVEIIDPVTVEGVEVSSTLIRHLLIKGEIQKARAMLGYYPFITGRVVTGAKLGRKLGFPTANLDIPRDVLVPANGVYLTKVTIKGEEHFGIANIGTKPTLELNSVKNIEVHLFDFENDIYNVEIKTEFLKRLREEKKFSGLDQLTAQIRSDAQEARKLLKSWSE